MNSNLVVYAVAVLLVVSVVVFIKAALFDHRPQKLGLLLAVLAAPLYLVYYNDRWPKQFGTLRMRDAVKPLNNLDGANSNFRSAVAPAIILALVLLVHLTVFQRVAVRERLQRVWDPIANFFAGTVVAALVGGTLVSTFAWGWPGAIVVTVVIALVYLGALALLGAIIELTVELSKLFLVWLNRKVFAIATWITRMSSWVSSLSGRLVSRGLIERIRADTAEQESIFLVEQESQDRALYEAYLRDRARKRRAAQRRGRALPPDELEAVAAGLAATAAAGTTPAVAPPAVTESVMMTESVAVTESLASPESLAASVPLPEGGPAPTADTAS
jgi:hypothetical protein